MPRIIVITGASSGLGAALAKAYAIPGVSLYLTGRNAERLQVTADACRNLGADVEEKVIYVENQEAMREWMEHIDNQTPIDLVIANAGISAGSGYSGESQAQAEAIFAANFNGVLHTIWPVIPRMQGRKCGQIAIIGSMAGLRGLPGAPAYSTSKAAVMTYGDALRGWLAKDDVRVSVVIPGYIRTNMTKDNAFPMPLLMNAEKAANIVKKGLEKRKGRIAFPLTIYCITRILASLPIKMADSILKKIPTKEET